MKKKLLIVAGIILAVLLVAAIALPLLVNADRFRPMVQAEMKSALGREVTIGKLQLSLLAGGVTAEELAIADDPAFSKSAFVKAKSLDVGVELMPLIFSRSLRVRTITLNQPEVSLLRNSAGKWNFSTLGTKEKAKPAAGSSQADFTIGEQKERDGRVNVGTRGRQFTYEEVNLTVSNVAFGQKMPLEVTAKTPGGGKVSVEGTAGPLDRADASSTPLNAQIKVEHLDLASTGFVDPSSGIAGVLDYEGKINSDGGKGRSEGKAEVSGLKVVRSGAPAKQKVALQYASEFDYARKAGTLTRGDIRTGNSTAKLSGNFDTRGETPVVHMKLVGNKLPVNDVSGLLPAFGVVLPSGATLEGGTVDANLSLDGPIDRLVTSGPLTVNNTRLAGYDLGSKMSALSALAGIKTGSQTDIQLLSSNLRVAPEGIRAENMNLIVPTIGTITGNGTIGANNALNFRMNAKLSQQSLLGGVSALTSFGQSKGSVPFMIQGTTSNPVFIPDMAGAVGQTVTAPAEGLGGVLGGFFGKKKPN